MRADDAYLIGLCFGVPIGAALCGLGIVLYEVVAR